MQHPHRALLATGLRRPLTLDLGAAQAVHATHGADMEGQEAEHRHDREAALLRAGGDWPRRATLGAHGTAGGAWARVDFQVALAPQTALPVDKTDRP